VDRAPSREDYRKTFNSAPHNQCKPLYGSEYSKMDRNVESLSHGTGEGYEPLLEFEDMEAKDEDRSEAVRGDSRQFSCSEYFGFFTIGLSMMWTWCVKIILQLEGIL
jgi:hypothetical protein